MKLSLNLGRGRSSGGGNKFNFKQFLFQHAEKLLLALACVFLLLMVFWGYSNRNQIDLVLLDLGLPDTSGLKVCQRLVDDPATSDIPIIVLSGIQKPDIIRSSRSAGCRYYVRKPYDPNALLVLIDRAIEETQLP